MPLDSSVSLRPMIDGSISDYTRFIIMQKISPVHRGTRLTPPRELTLTSATYLHEVVGNSILVSSAHPL
jgi:hypothetical protein